MMLDGPPRVAAAVMKILLPPNQAPEALLNHLIESNLCIFYTLELLRVKLTDTYVDP